jgi:Fibronectin type III domain
MTKYLYLILFSIILSLSLSPKLFAQDITLSWDPSPTTSVIGYKIYYKYDSPTPPFNGVGAIEGPSPVDVKNVQSATLSGLINNSTYYFTVTAYDATGNESSYSNVVNSDGTGGAGGDISLIRPSANATNEPVPVTFQWSSSVSATMSYTLYYGTDAEQVQSAGTFTPTYPSSPRSNTLYLEVFLLILAMLVVVQTTKKRIIFSVGILATCLALSACGGGGGGDSLTSSNKTSTGTPNISPAVTVYSVEKGSSDYHQAFDLLPGTTYYWKVVGVDTTDPTQVFTSAVANFTTENY